MNVLFVAREKKDRRVVPFIEEQIESLRAIGVNVDLRLIRHGGGRGYARAALALRTEAAPYDVVHGHGPAAACLSLVRATPTVATFHGSEVTRRTTRVLSGWTASRASWVIYVSERLRQTAWIKGANTSVIPCGVDLDLFRPVERGEAREQLGWDPSERVALFAGSFDVAVKNVHLARAGAERWGGVLKELRGYTRDQVVLAMNAADALLLTSHSEGSPQVVKEALACNVPVVSTDVGDVAERLQKVANCHIVAATPQAVSQALHQVAGLRTNGRSRVEPLSLVAVARKIKLGYESL